MRIQERAHCPLRLDGSAQPLTVTSYTYETLPADEQATLPSTAAISAALEHDPTGVAGA